MVESLREFFDTIPGRAEPARLTGIEAVFRFVAEGDGGGAWLVSVAQGGATVLEEGGSAAALTVTGAAEDWLRLLNGDLGMPSALLTGQIKLSGDITLGLVLEHVLAM